MERFKGDMDCELAQQQILLADDPAADVAASAALSAHVNQCQACCELLARTQKVAVGTRHLPAGPASEPSPAFLARVRELVAASRAAPARAPRRLWIPRAAAAAIIMAIGLLALSLCLFNNPPARADTLLSDLSSWNLRISQAKSMEDRVTIFQSQIAQMQERLKTASLSTQERAVAQAMLDTADRQAHDPSSLENAQRLADLADRLTTLPPPADMAHQTILAQVRIDLRQGLEVNLQQVNTSTLSPADLARFHTLQQRGQQAPQQTLPSVPPQNSAEAPRVPIDPFGGLGFGPGRIFSNPRRDIVVVPGMDMRPSPASAPQATPPQKLDPGPTITANSSGREHAGPANPRPPVRDSAPITANTSGNTPPAGAATPPRNSLARSQDPLDEENADNLQLAPATRQPTNRATVRVPVPKSSGSQPPATADGASGQEKDVPPANKKEMNILDPSGIPILPMPFLQIENFAQTPLEIFVPSGTTQGLDFNYPLVGESPDLRGEPLHFGMGNMAYTGDGSLDGFTLTPSTDDSADAFVGYIRLSGPRTFATPEPSTAIAGLGLVLLMLRRSRRKANG